MKKKNRPYNYNSKSRLTPNSQSFPFKVNNMKNDMKTNLENTLTKLHIIEELPPEDSEPLDNSFLGGRVEKKEEKPKKIKKEKKVKEKKPKEKKTIDRELALEKVAFFKKLFLSLSGICAAILVLLFLSHFVGGKIADIYHSARSKIIVTDRKNANMVDDNFVFVGDFHTKSFSFKKYGMDYHYVNNGTMDLTTSHLLAHMKDMIYDYNPSVVFIEVGLMDLNSGVSEDVIIDNYGRIIDLIKSNRPNAIVFVESVYPINKDVNSYNGELSSVSNSSIESLNKALKNLAKQKDVRYLDVYSDLNEKGKLKSDYTKDGVSLNEKGYSEVYNNINNLLG